MSPAPRKVQRSFKESNRTVSAAQQPPAHRFLEITLYPLWKTAQQHALWCRRQRPSHYLGFIRHLGQSHWRAHPAASQHPLWQAHSKGQPVKHRLCIPHWSTKREWRPLSGVTDDWEYHVLCCVWWPWWVRSSWLLWKIHGKVHQVRHEVVLHICYGNL